MSMLVAYQRVRVDVEREDIHWIAHPGHDLAVCPEHDAANVLHRSVCRVVPRQPWRIEERHRSGLGDRDCLVDPENVAIEVGGVDLDLEEVPDRPCPAALPVFGGMG